MNINDYLKKTKKTPVNVRIDDDLYKRLVVFRRQKKVTLRAVVEAAIRKFLDEIR